MYIIYPPTLSNLEIGLLIFFDDLRPQNWAREGNLKAAGQIGFLGQIGPTWFRSLTFIRKTVRNLEPIVLESLWAGKMPPKKS